MKKKCTGKCREIKPLDEFSNKKANRDGKNNQCRDCVREARQSRANIQKVIVPVKLNKKCMDGWWL
jgi:hypothetical protein